MSLFDWTKGTSELFMTDDMMCYLSTLEQRLQGKRGGKSSMLDQYNQQKEQSQLFQYKKGAIEDEYEVGKDLGSYLR